MPADMKNWGQDRPRRCLCAACCLTSLAAAMVVLAGLRHAWRGSKLEPLLKAIVSSDVCLDSTTGVCTLSFSEADAAAFDLHEREREVLGFLYGQVARGERGEMRQVLSGAHVKLQDADGFVYDFLRRLPAAHRRISSHSSDRPQYGVPEGRVLSALLVGTLSNATWLQLEGSPWDPGHRPLGSLGHVLDFLEYAASGRNVGPLGTSPSTDRRPLLAGPPAPVSEACPRTCPAEAVAAVAASPSGGGSRTPAADLAASLTPVSLLEEVQANADGEAAISQLRGRHRRDAHAQGSRPDSAGAGIRVGRKKHWRLAPE